MDEEFTDIFNEPYDINRHDYTGKLTLDEYIHKVFTGSEDYPIWEDYFKYVFTNDIVRYHGTVNDDLDDKYTWFVGTNKMDVSKKYEYLSSQFDKFIRTYVSISDEDIKKFKAFTTQNCSSVITFHLLKMFEGTYFITNSTQIYHFTLYKNNFKCNFTLTFDLICQDPEVITGNGSYSMLFDVTNNKYSANIQLHFNQPSQAPIQPSQQENQECFTYLKSFFGGTRKKSKVYGMPYTYRKVYRKKCYKVSNKKRVFSKCTSKKRALRQIRLLRYLESK